MGDDKKASTGRKATSDTQTDTDADLQEELRREAAEGGDKTEDVSSNRNVGGSSTWETLPDNDRSDNES